MKQFVAAVVLLNAAICCVMFDTSVSNILIVNLSATITENQPVPISYRQQIHNHWN